MLQIHVEMHVFTSSYGHTSLTKTKNCQQILVTLTNIPVQV
jgi:hypothetical protein